MEIETGLWGAPTPVRLHRWPRPDARYVAVIVHGYGEHAGRYDRVVEALVGHGATVWAADHPGHGRSAGDRGLIESLDRLVADTATVVTDARNRHPGLPVVVIGQSLGGTVATRFTQQHGDELSALVLAAPVIGDNPYLRRLINQADIPEVSIDPALLSRDPMVGRLYSFDPLVWRRPIKRATLEALVKAVDDVASGGSLGSLPTLWLHGEDDSLAPLERTREAIEHIRGSNFEERLYPGARHEILNEINKDEVLADIKSFLDRVLD